MPTESKPFDEDCLLAVSDPNIKNKPLTAAEMEAIEDEVFMRQRPMVTPKPMSQWTDDELGSLVLPEFEASMLSQMPISETTDYKVIDPKMVFVRDVKPETMFAARAEFTTDASAEYQASERHDSGLPDKVCHDTDGALLPIKMNGNRVTAYIAGPMSSLALFNFPAFDAARDDLTAKGFKAINPADIDREIGFDPSVGTLDDFDLPAAIRRDVDAILYCDAVVLLPGHEDSNGATAERYIAKWAGIPCYTYPDLKPYRESNEPTAEEVEQAAKDFAEWVIGAAMEGTHKSPQKDILLEAYDATTGDRQSSYGPPDQDFRRTAGMWTALFGDMLKDGVEFEPFHVAQAMILLKMSRQLHQRKRDNWIDTAGYARCGQVCDEAAKSRQ